MLQTFCFRLNSQPCYVFLFLHPISKMLKIKFCLYEPKHISPKYTMMSARSLLYWQISIRSCVTWTKLFCSHRGVFKYSQQHYNVWAVLNFRFCLQE